MKLHVAFDELLGCWTATCDCGNTYPNVGGPKAPAFDVGDHVCPCPKNHYLGKDCDCGTWKYGAEWAEEKTGGFGPEAV